MRGVSKPLSALAAILLLALALGACGGGDSEDSTAAATTGEATATAPAQPSEDTDQPSGSEDGDSSDESSSPDSSSDPTPTGEGSAAFRTPGGDNSIQDFGEEPDSDEIEVANEALAGFMQARSEQDWEGMCTYLAEATLAPLEDLAARAPQFKGKGCAAILKGLLSTSQSVSSTNTLTEGIASFRVEGERGFALYHGPKGVDYFVPMIEEDGEWKVGSLAPSEFP